jgi:predicted transcriptional regulator
MVRQDKNGEKNALSSNLGSQTKLETLVNILGMSIINISTLSDLANEKKISSKNMKAYLGSLLNQGLIRKTSQDKKFKIAFSLTQRGINVLRYFGTCQMKSQIELKFEMNKMGN